MIKFAMFIVCGLYGTSSVAWLYLTNLKLMGKRSLND